MNICQTQLRGTTAYWAFDRFPLVLLQHRNDVRSGERVKAF
jgi:hypothetical protein